MGGAGIAFKGSSVLRAKRFALFALLIAVFVVVVLLIPKLVYRHPYVNTAGEIVFASDRGSPGQSHLFLARPDGSMTRQITSGRENDLQPSFSHDGTQITFVSDRTGTPQVYVMDASGDSQRAISFGTDQKLMPRFSSDGQSVGYISRGQLIVANVIGGHTGIVLPTTANVSASSTATLSAATRAPVVSFAWSPSTSASEQDKIAAVQQTPDGDLQVVSIVDASDASVAPKVLGGGTLASVAWSPDGKQIATALLGASGPNGTPINLSGIADFDQSGALVYSTPIAAAPSRTIGPQAPTFSPDGKQLMFVITRLSNLNTPISNGLAVTPAQPGAQVQRAIGGSAHDPQLAPVGAQFLFLGPAGPGTVSQGLFVADPATKQIKALTTAAENVTAAVWSPALPSAK